MKRKTALIQYSLIEALIFESDVAEAQSRERAERAEMALEDPAGTGLRSFSRSDLVGSCFW